MSRVCIGIALNFLLFELLVLFVVSGAGAHNSFEASLVLPKKPPIPQTCLSAARLSSLKSNLHLLNYFSHLTRPHPGNICKRFLIFINSIG